MKLGILDSSSPGVLADLVAFFHFFGYTGGTGFSRDVGCEKEICQTFGLFET